MSLLLRFVRLLPISAVALVPAICAGACNAQVATVLASDAGPDAPSTGGGGSCTQDHECNADPAISSLRGTCSGGVCVCNAGTTTTANGRCQDPPADAGTTTGDCVAKGGKCLAKGAAAPPSYRVATAGEGSCSDGEVCWVSTSTTPAPVCTKDQDCNGDPAVSALWGRCFFGVCMCNPGHTVQPNGKCHTPPPPDCATQKGTCRQMPATCLASELGSEGQTNMSCGDFIAAVCCNDAKSCNGPAREVAGSGFAPVEFICCAPNDSAHPPICVNGWQQCPSGDTPVAKPGGCG